MTVSSSPPRWAHLLVAQEQAVMVQLLGPGHEEPAAVEGPADRGGLHGDGHQGHRRVLDAVEEVGRLPVERPDQLGGDERRGGQHHGVGVDRGRRRRA